MRPAAARTDVWHLSYGYDADDNITAITDHVTPANSRSFGYDSVDRLNRVDGGASGFAREDYVHDRNGNLLRVERRLNAGDTSPAQSDTYVIASGTNRLGYVAHAAGTRSFTHDARGNLTADTRPAGAGVTLGYDGHARLASYARTGGETQTMLHNGFDANVRGLGQPCASGYSAPTPLRRGHRRRAAEQSEAMCLAAGWTARQAAVLCAFPSNR